MTRTFASAIHQRKGDDRLLTPEELKRIQTIDVAIGEFLAKAQMEEEVREFVVGHYQQLVGSFANLFKTQFASPPINVYDIRVGIATSLDNLLDSLRRDFKRPTWDDSLVIHLQLLYHKFADDFCCTIIPKSSISLNDGS